MLTIIDISVVGAIGLAIGWLLQSFKTDHYKRELKEKNEALALWSSESKIWLKKLTEMESIIDEVSKDVKSTVSEVGKYSPKTSNHG